MGRHGLDSCGPGQGQVADFCECDSVPSGPLKCEEFLVLRAVTEIDLPIPM